MAQNYKNTFFIPFMVGVAVAAIAGLVIVLSVYFFNFHGPIGNQEQFGQFGDFIGGLLNPIFSFLTITLLIISIFIQRQELNKVVDELELAREVHISSVNMRHYEYLISKAMDPDSEFQTSVSMFRLYIDEKIGLNLPDDFSISRHEFSLFEILANTELLYIANQRGYETYNPLSPTSKKMTFRPFSEKLDQLNAQLITMMLWIKQVESLGCPSWRAKDVLDIGMDILTDYYQKHPEEYKVNIKRSLIHFEQFRSSILGYSVT